MVFFFNFADFAAIWLFFTLLYYAFAKKNVFVIIMKIRICKAIGNELNHCRNHAGENSN